MNFDFEFQITSNNITFYFNKISNVIESFVDKHTREIQNKKSIEFEYVFRQKISIQFKRNQNFASQFFKTKRKKIINIQIFRAFDLSDSDQNNEHVVKNSKTKIECVSKTSSITNFFQKFNTTIFRFFFVATNKSRFISKIHKYNTIIINFNIDQKFFKCNRCFKIYLYMLRACLANRSGK